MLHNTVKKKIGILFALEDMGGMKKFVNDYDSWLLCKSIYLGGITVTDKYDLSSERVQKRCFYKFSIENVFEKRSFLSSDKSVMMDHSPLYVSMYEWVLNQQNVNICLGTGNVNSGNEEFFIPFAIDLMREIKSYQKKKKFKVANVVIDVLYLVFSHHSFRVNKGNYIKTLNVERIMLSIGSRFGQTSGSVGIVRFVIPTLKSDVDHLDFLVIFFEIYGFFPHRSSKKKLIKPKPKKEMELDNLL